MSIQKIPQWVVDVILLAATLSAVAFLFWIIPFMYIKPLIDKGKYELAEDVFMVISHVAAIAITYWFATSRNGGRNRINNENGGGNTKNHREYKEGDTSAQ